MSYQSVRSEVNRLIEWMMLSSIASVVNRWEDDETAMRKVLKCAAVA